MYEYLLSAAESFIRYGMSPTALVVALVALFRTKRFKRFIGRRAPWLFKDDADVLNYQSRQIRIENDVRAIKAHLGVSECAERPISLTGTERSSLKSSQVDGLSVRFANALMRQVSTFISRGNRKMKNKFLSRKFILAVAGCVVIILNDMLELNVDKDTVFTFAGIIATWIATEGVVDAKRKIDAPNDDGGNHYS